MEECGSHGPIELVRLAAAAISGISEECRPTGRLRFNAENDPKGGESLPLSLTSRERLFAATPSAGTPRNAP